MALRWAAQRQLLYATIVVGILIIGGVWAYFTYFFSPASCYDGVQNQDELGIDCGGTCALLCEAPNISSVWSRSVEVAPGVYHAVSMVRNPDTTARGDVSYTISLFDSENILIATRNGVFTIEPGEVRPLFEANIIAGERAVQRTFIDLVPGMFEQAQRENPKVRILSWELNEEALRLSAVIENQELEVIDNTILTALLFDEEELLIAASQTNSGVLNSRERKTVTFTWQQPFNDEVTRVDIIPRIE